MYYCYRVAGKRGTIKSHMKRAAPTNTHGKQKQALQGCNDDKGAPSTSSFGRRAEETNAGSSAAAADCLLTSRSSNLILSAQDTRNGLVGAFLFGVASTTAVAGLNTTIDSVTQSPCSVGPSFAIELW